MDKIRMVLDRFKEPSTYAGLAGAAMLLGMNDAQYLQYATAAAGVCAFLAIVLKETNSDV